MRFFHLLVVGSVTVVAVIFALSNREKVSFDLWPIPHTVDAPPVVAVFAGLVAGMLVGALIAWAAGRKWRQLARARDQELRRARRELARIREATPRPADGAAPSLAESGPE